MVPERRLFIVTGFAALASAACDSSSIVSSPIPTAPSPPTAPRVRAQLIAPTGNNVFEIQTNEQFSTVAELLSYVGLTLDIQDSDKWLTQSGQSFSGGLVRGVRAQTDPQMRRGNWLVRIGTHRLCFDVRNQAVPPNIRVGLYFDNGVVDTTGCA